jgi:hypothetical protein
MNNIISSNSSNSSNYFNIYYIIIAIVIIFTLTILIIFRNDILKIFIKNDSDNENTKLLNRESVKCVTNGNFWTGNCETPENYNTRMLINQKNITLLNRDNIKCVNDGNFWTGKCETPQNYNKNISLNAENITLLNQDSVKCVNNGNFWTGKCETPEKYKRIQEILSCYDNNNIYYKDKCITDDIDNNYCQNCYKFLNENVQIATTAITSETSAVTSETSAVTSDTSAVTSETTATIDTIPTITESDLLIFNNAMTNNGFANFEMGNFNLSDEFLNSLNNTLSRFSDNEKYIAAKVFISYLSGYNYKDISDIAFKTYVLPIILALKSLINNKSSTDEIINIYKQLEKNLKLIYYTTDIPSNFNEIPTNDEIQLFTTSMSNNGFPNFEMGTFNLSNEFLNSLSNTLTKFSENEKYIAAKIFLYYLSAYSYKDISNMNFKTNVLPIIYALRNLLNNQSSSGETINIYLELLKSFQIIFSL